MCDKRTNYTSETKLEKEVLYSRMVKAGNFVFIGGTTAVDDKGEVRGLGHSYEQTRFILEKQIAYLKRAGAMRKDVVKVNMYVTPDYDISGDRAFTELFGDVHPLCTLIVVNGLFRKELLIEIEMTAIIGCNTEEDQVTLL